jgi:hypothetical protein
LGDRLAEQYSTFEPLPGVKVNGRFTLGENIGDLGGLNVALEAYKISLKDRYFSKDSRFWGVVPRANVRGRPHFIYYSYNGEDSDRPLPFITDIRWGRIGHLIK